MAKRVKLTRLSGVSPLRTRITVSSKSPRCGSPVRLNATAPAFLRAWHERRQDAPHNGRGRSSAFPRFPSWLSRHPQESPGLSHPSLPEKAVRRAGYCRHYGGAASTAYRNARRIAAGLPISRAACEPSSHPRPQGWSIGRQANGHSQAGSRSPLRAPPFPLSPIGGDAQDESGNRELRSRTWVEEDGIPYRCPCGVIRIVDNLSDYCAWRSVRVLVFVAV